MKLVPELRFSEFVKEGEWMEKTLGEVAIFTKGKGISKSDIAENGKLPCIRYGELYTHYNETISDIKSHTNLDPNDLILSEVNDVIIPASGETQIDIATASCVLGDGIALGGDLNIIKTNINGVFLAYYLNSAKKRDIAQIAQGISVVHLYSNQLKSLIVDIPNPQEQQKIADCLSSFDALITTQTQKLQALQQHKKGLMQNLFPTEGKTTPKLRFPEFVKEGEWAEKQLSEVCDITNGKANVQDHIEEGQYPLFDRSEIIKASNEYIFDCEVVIIPGEGMRFIPKYYEGKFNLHQRAYALKDFTSIGQFVYYSMLHRSGLLSQKAVQSTVLSLRLPILQNFPIEIPDNPQEQQKIADCLSSLDALITTQTQKLQALQQHKKGLMQGLFPKFDN